MKRPILVTLLGSSLLALTFQPAQAADRKQSTGFYVSGNFGAAMPNEITLDDSNYPTEDPKTDILEARTEPDLDVGYSFGGAVGYDFGAIRIEGEVSKRGVGDDRIFNMTEDAITGQPVPKYKFRTEIDRRTALSLMANAWYDIDTGTRFTPYIGGGAGVAQVSIESYDTDVKRVTTGYHDISETVFAYQAGIGVDMSLAEDVVVGLGYRYFATSDIAGAGGNAAFHSVNLGMRYTF